METKDQDVREVRDLTWRIVGRVSLVVGSLLFGLGLGYTFWGDAPRLESRVGALEERIVSLQYERDNLEHKVGLLERRLEAAQEAGQEVSP